MPAGIFADRVPMPEATSDRVNDPYARWIMRNEPGKAAVAAQRLQQFDRQPQIVLLLPVVGSPHPFLAAAIEAVIEQTYRNWELRLIVSDPGSEAVSRTVSFLSGSTDTSSFPRRPARELPASAIVDWRRPAVSTWR